jgi:ubiquinone/menaquinone biosynthesis C-methylase UbiE
MNNLNYAELLEKKDIFHTAFVDIFLDLYEDYLINLENLDNFSLIDEKILNDKTFKKSLTLMHIPSIRWETVLTKLRKEVCFKTVSGYQYSDSFLSLIECLSIQCFLTDYVYNFDASEITAIKSLQLNLNKDNIKFYAPIIGCYLPLFDIIKDEVFEYQENCFFNIQIKEPLEDLKIKQNLERVGHISDTTSKLVMKQYVENPYPKWRYTFFTPQKFAMSVEENIQKMTCNSYKQLPPTKFKESKILISGCGTGQQIIGANNYKNVQITAIDLSDNSLAYAKRKVDEYGMKNVRFIVMDLLDIGLLNEKFDVIECGGVLHHMSDPNKGLSVLSQTLVSGGYMKIGLYSKKSRTAVTKARHLIESLKKDSIHDKIRYFRQKVFNGDYPELQDLTMMIDFYGLSTCRDYCFHVCEHQFTIDDIISLLKINNLKFCGFNLPDFIKKDYSMHFPDDKTLTNLENWDIYETNNPNTFKNMYQFIVQSNKND